MDRITRNIFYAILKFLKNVIIIMMLQKNKDKLSIKQRQKLTKNFC